MKVICVDNTNENKSLPDPVLGDNYTVIDECEFGSLEYYQFSELKAPYPFRWWYLKSRFIPLSSISETEFVRNYNTEKV